ncbi:MAG: phosphotransferase [Pseudomonadales bacterium]
MSNKTHTVNEEKLANYLATQIPGFKGPLTATKFAGGQSNPTFHLKSGSGGYVLRRKPPGELLKSAHAVDREFRVISALAKSDVPVAEAYTLCEDESVIGSMFYVMQYIDGRVLWDPRIPELDNTERAAIYDEMNRVLAALHRVDVEAAGLGDFGKPGNYYARQISRWSKQYRAAETETIEAMDHLIDWLPANLPADDGMVSLVHGDYRLDNMLFHRSEPKVLAVVDWELSTLGHPYADLAYQCAQWRLPAVPELKGLAGIDRTSLGIPEEEDYVTRYCVRQNISSIPDWNFYMVFCCFRFASIIQGVKKRALDGNASSEEAINMGAVVPLVAQTAVDLI